MQGSKTHRALLARLMRELSAEADAAQLGAITNAFLVDLEARSTVAHYRRTKTCLGRICGALGVELVSELRPPEIEQYLHRRVSEGASVRTANMEWGALSAALNWAERRQLVGLNPLRGTQKLRQGRHTQARPRRAFTDAELGRFLHSVRLQDAEPLQHRPGPRYPTFSFWLALAETGARFGEMTGALWGDLLEDPPALRLRAATTKSRKERVIPVRESLRVEVDSFRLAVQRNRGREVLASEPVFVSPCGCKLTSGAAHRVFAKALTRGGIEKSNHAGERLDIHSLRYTFATRLQRSGVTLAYAQKLLGHSRPELTANIYTDLAQDDYRGAVESMPELELGVG